MKSTLVYLTFLLLLVHFVIIHADDNHGDHKDSHNDSLDDSDNGSRSESDNDSRSDSDNDSRSDSDNNSRSDSNNDSRSDSDSDSDSNSNSKEHCPKVNCPREYELIKNPHDGGCPYCRPIRLSTTTRCPDLMCPPCYEEATKKDIKCPFCKKIDGCHKSFGCPQVTCQPRYVVYYPPRGCPYCIKMSPTVTTPSTTTSPCPIVTCQTGYMRYDPPYGCPYCIPDPNYTTTTPLPPTTTTKKPRVL